MARIRRLNICFIAGIIFFSALGFSRAEDRSYVPFDAGRVSIPSDIKYILKNNKSTTESVLALLIPVSRFKVRFADVLSKKKEYEFVSLTTYIPPGFDIEKFKKMVSGKVPQVQENYDVYTINPIDKLYISKTKADPALFICITAIVTLCQALSNTTIFVNPAPARPVPVNMVYSFSSEDMENIGRIDDDMRRVVNLITK